MSTNVSVKKLFCLVGAYMEIFLTLKMCVPGSLRLPLLK